MERSSSVLGERRLCENLPNATMGGVIHNLSRLQELGLLKRVGAGSTIGKSWKDDCQRTPMGSKLCDGDYLDSVPVFLDGTLILISHYDKVVAFQLFCTFDDTVYLPLLRFGAAHIITHLDKA